MRRLIVVLALVPLVLVAAPAGARAASTETTAPVAPAAVAAPEVPAGFVLSPAFVMKDGKEYPAGSAFVVDFNSLRVVVTAHSLFGPLGGMPIQLGPEEIPQQLKEVRLMEAYSREKLGKTSTAAVVPGAHPMAKDAAGDVAVLRFSSEIVDMISTSSRATFQGRPLAAADPKVGDPVWLAASLVDGPGKDARTHAGHVGMMDGSWLFFDYDEQGLNLAGTVGAPILNAAGEIVGVNIGGGVREGKAFGSAVPLAALRTNLTNALK